MKKIEWLTHNRMKFESEHKTFNRQTQCISTGNIVSNTLLGWYIRPFNETKCNGFDFEPGNLQKADLKTFRNLPHYVEGYGRNR